MTLSKVQYKIDIKGLVHALGIARAVLVIYPDGGLRLHRCDHDVPLVTCDEISQHLAEKVDDHYNT